MSTDYSSRTREYYLILPAKTGPEYGGGWAPGSVIAHWFHLKKGFPGVFWVWGLSSSGIRDEDKLYFENLIDPLGKHFKINGRQICISRKGYIYEAENHSITWEFEASYIIKDAELSSEAEKRLKKDESCIPLFRKEYLRPELWGSWLLIRDLKQLVEPISGKKFDALYSFPDFKYFSNKEHKLIDLTTSHLASGNAFVSILPKKLETKDPKPEVEISEYLRQFLSDSPPKGKLRESNIHDALIFQLLKKGYYFLHEKAIKNGRYDVLFKDPNGKLIALEIKLKRGDSAVDQLKGYIVELKKRYDEDIKGAIICGKSDDNLQKIAKENGFKVIEYQLLIKIPLKAIT